MAKSEFIKEIDELLKHFEIPQEDEEPAPANKRWRADEGEKYYYVTDFGHVSWTNDVRECGDDFRYYSHNYFKTLDDAFYYLKILEIENELRQFADEHNILSPQKWFLAYQYEIIACSAYESAENRRIYFSSEEIAKEAVETIGREKVKEYLIYAE